MNKTESRIAVTGIGMVSPLGNDVDSTWQALMAGKNGVQSIQGFDASHFPTTIAAEVKDFQMEPQALDKRLQRFCPSFVKFGAQAAFEALQDARLFPAECTRDRWGLVVGSGMMTAEFDYWQRFQSNFAEGGKVDWHKMANDNHSFYQPSSFGRAQANTGLALLSQQYDIRGYCNSVHTACASGGQALGLALRAMRRGDCDYMLVGGFESMINPFGLSSFCLLGAVSGRNDAPHLASRPFDFNRDGFVLGEGAAFMVLEKWQNAEARGATIYAEIAGEGNSLSSYRITDSHPSGDGAIQCVQSALRDSGASVSEVDYINAHGTSTKMNDACETNAIKAVFGDKAYQIPVSSTKSQTGHLIAAAGALEGAFTALSIYHGSIPMTANLETPDPECDLDYVSDKPRSIPIRVALSNSFGFGGSNSCIAFRHAEYPRETVHDS